MPGDAARNRPEFEPDFVDEINALESIVDRSGRGDGPSADTRERVLTYAHEALARQRETLRLAGIPLVPVGSETTLLVPDTNALYGNPYLDEWGVSMRRRSSSSLR